MKLDIGALQNNVDTAALLDKPVSEWREILSQECQVYIFGESYLGKRFDTINYKFCGKNEAKDIVIDNLYYILRYKYFPSSSEEIDDKIAEIVKSFTLNLKSTIKKVTFEKDEDGELKKQIPNYCVAFRNGVYNFKDNKWMFKYDIIDIKSLCTRLYMYDTDYIINWYCNFDFEPLPINIMTMSLEKFMESMKEITKVNRNYCFELMYNISHDVFNKFSMEKFIHLCQINGYLILQQFCQSFVIFIGEGGNGKNSLYDACFTKRVIPRPVQNSLSSIEEDRFITGALENRYHNLYFEAKGQVYEDSTVLKVITGSQYQTIENKGEPKRPGFLNCKYIFSANEQEKIKFKDDTKGFRRRVNMYEITYSWDEHKTFLKKGDYYDTTFSDDLHEITSDLSNNVVFIYLGMYGIMSATNNFKDTFRFTFNDWRLKYTDRDTSLKDAIESVSMLKIIQYIKSSKTRYEECKPLFYDMDRVRLYNSHSLKSLGCDSYDEMISMFLDEENVMNYFSEYDCYISIRILQNIVGDLRGATTFNQNIKKLYGVEEMPLLSNNRPYVKCNFATGHLRIIK